LAVETNVHQIRPELDGPTDVHDASRTEHGYSVSGPGKRAPGFDLAGSALSDLRVVNIICSAEPCPEGELAIQKKHESKHNSENVEASARGCRRTPSHARKDLHEYGLEAV
jgi:hypothetical protein